MSRRRGSALLNVAAKRGSIVSQGVIINPPPLLPVNLKKIIKIYFLDGSSKTLQATSNTLVSDILINIRYNLDLRDSSTIGLYLIKYDNNLNHIKSERLLKLNEKIFDLISLSSTSSPVSSATSSASSPTSSSTSPTSSSVTSPSSTVTSSTSSTDNNEEIKLLLRICFTFSYGCFDCDVFQYGIRNKISNSSLWLTYLEVNYMLITNQYYLTEEESFIIGCIKLQIESGDYNPLIHTNNFIISRILTRFPESIKNKYILLNNNNNINEINKLIYKIQNFYSKLNNKNIIQSKIILLETLKIICPYYGGKYYNVHLQLISKLNNNNKKLTTSLGSNGKGNGNGSNGNGNDDDEYNPSILKSKICITENSIYLFFMNCQPVLIFTHNYNRILHFYKNNNILQYYILKPNITSYDLEEYYNKLNKKNKKNKNKNKNNDNNNDITISNLKELCDMVYIVSPRIDEIYLLFEAYMKAQAKGIPPCHENAPEELKMPNVCLDHKAFNPFLNGNDDDDDEEIDEEYETKIDEDKNKSQSNNTNNTTTSNNNNEKNTTNSSKTSLSILSRMIKTLNSNSSVSHGDDSPGLSSSIFQNQSTSIESIPKEIQYASSMIEISHLAETKSFSDDDDDSNEDSDSEYSDDD